MIASTMEKEVINQFNRITSIYKDLHSKNLISTQVYLDLVSDACLEAQNRLKLPYLKTDIIVTS